MKLNTCMVYYVNDGVIAGKSPATLRNYKYVLGGLTKYLEKEFIPLELGSITIEVLNHFLIEGIKYKKWNKYTVWTYYRGLSAFCEWCIRRKYLSSNPLKEIPTPKLPQMLPKTLNEQEIKLVLRTVAAIPSKFYFFRVRNKAFIAMLLFTGLRKTEILGLRLEEVDLLNGFLTVEHGKGGKRREIPIEQKMLSPILNEYMEHRSRLQKSSDYFFTGTFEGRGERSGKMADSTVYRLFKRISQSCDKRVHAHKLRHTFATQFLEKTGDIYILKDLMGHSKIETTCIYLSTTRRKKVEAMSKMVE